MSFDMPNEPDADQQEYERWADLRDAAPDLLAACEAVIYFWESDPLAFGDDATVTSLAGRFAAVANKCRAAVAKTKPAAPHTEGE